MKILGLILLLSTALNCSAQSLADTARKERERRQQVHSIAVFSNVGAPAAVSAGSSSTVIGPLVPAPVQVPSAQAAGPTDNKGRDEKYWKAAFQKARDDVKRAEEKAQILDLKVKELNTMLLQRSDIYDRENVIGPQITAAKAELEIAQHDVELATQKVADLEDDLRRSGGLPGWAR